MNENDAIKVHQLIKLYKGSLVPAVKNVSFEIHHGEIFGLLGPNGAGKTTTLSIICGLLKQTSGSVFINGLSHDSHHKEIKKLIGVVPQEIALYPTLTAYENLRYFGNMFLLKGKSLDDIIYNHLARFGLTDVAKKQIGTFSGGMKRRINLIAGILHQPKVLFLDEPTVGVDVQSRSMIAEFLRDLNKAGTTIVYTSHLMDEAQNLCSRIAIMDHGLIIIQGEPRNIIEQHNCSNLEELFLNLTGKNLRD